MIQIPRYLLAHPNIEAVFDLKGGLLVRHHTERYLHLHRLPQRWPNDLRQIGPRLITHQIALLRFEGQQHLIPFLFHHRVDGKLAQSPPHLGMGNQFGPGITAVVPPECEGGNCASVMLVRRGEFNSDWLCFVMNSRAVRYQVEIVQYGAAQEQFNINHAVEFVVSKPPRTEQDAIATFLDRETAKIDALVAEQEKLIALLQEKRQAVISHAVTKGLDPNVPMKDSGVEWLGEVPAHWEVLKGALIGNLFGSEQVPEDLVTDEGDLPFIKVGSMSSDSFEIESWNWFVDRTVADQYRAKTGYIVFPKRGAAIFLNKVNIVDRPSLIDPNLMGWEIGKNAIREFFAYALKSRKLDELADVSTVPQINNKHIAPERFPVPPVTEQRDIVTFLQAETGEIDSLTAEARSAITLLQERRTALISAAVTGQIDVRGLAGGTNTPDLIAASACPASA